MADDRGAREIAGLPRNAGLPRGHALHIQIIVTTIMVKITFDEAKRAITLLEQGLDFADADQVFSGPTVTIEDTRRDYGETRWITMGLLGWRAVVLVWTPRGVDSRRIISMRHAHDDEVERFGLHLG